MASIEYKYSIEHSVTSDTRGGGIGIGRGLYFLDPEHSCVVYCNTSDPQDLHRGREDCGIMGTNAVVRMGRDWLREVSVYGGGSCGSRGGGVRMVRWWLGQDSNK